LRQAAAQVWCVAPHIVTPGLQCHSVTVGCGPSLAWCLTAWGMAHCWCSVLRRGVWPTAGVVSPRRGVWPTAGVVINGVGYGPQLVLSQSINIVTRAGTHRGAGWVGVVTACGPSWVSGCLGVGCGPSLVLVVMAWVCACVCAALHAVVVPTCVLPARCAAEGSPMDAPICALPIPLAAGGVVLRVSVVCGSHCCCAGVVPCSVHALFCCPLVLPPLAGCWSWARRGAFCERRRLYLFRVSALLYQGGCMWGLPYVQCSLGYLCHVLCPAWAEGGACLVHSSQVPARVTSFIHSFVTRNAMLTSSPFLVCWSCLGHVVRPLAA
jgi:hypothetical protein